MIPLEPPTGLTQRRRGVGISNHRPGEHKPAPVTRYEASGGHPSLAAGATFALSLAWAYSGRGRTGEPCWAVSSRLWCSCPGRSSRSFPAPDQHRERTGSLALAQRHLDAARGGVTSDQAQPALLPRFGQIDATQANRREKLARYFCRGPNSAIIGNKSGG